MKRQQKKEIEHQKQEQRKRQAKIKKRLTDIDY